MPPGRSQWDVLFDRALEVIDACNAEHPVIDRWTFGGGTALMLQIGHRDSHDIDIFIDDPQLLPYLNPQTKDWALRRAPDAYHENGTVSLRLVYEGAGEIDFIACGWALAPAAAEAEIRGRKVMLERPEEIIAKKVLHRGGNFQPRDMFDLVAAARHVGLQVLVEALATLGRDPLERAAHVSRRLAPWLMREIMGGYMIRPDHQDLLDVAQQDAVAILEEAAPLTPANPP